MYKCNTGKLHTGRYVSYVVCVWNLHLHAQKEAGFFKDFELFFVHFNAHGATNYEKGIVKEGLLSGL